MKLEIEAEWEHDTFGAHRLMWKCHELAKVVDIFGPVVWWVHDGKRIEAESVEAAKAAAEKAMRGIE